MDNWFVSVQDENTLDEDVFIFENGKQKIIERIFKFEASYAHNIWIWSMFN